MLGALILVSCLVFVLTARERPPSAAQPPGVAAATAPPTPSLPGADRWPAATDAATPGSEPPIAKTPGPAGSFTLVATGDLLSHGSVLDQARADFANSVGGSGYDYSAMLGPVTPTISAADVAICHLETPIVPPGVEPGVQLPIFGAPPAIATEIVEAGYDRCSTASNHSLDQRVAGIDSTLSAFDAAGLGQAGMGRTAAEGGPALFTVGGITVAHLSASYAFNGFSPPADQPWRVNLIDAKQIVAQAHEARAAGAQVVIVSLHWGDEGTTEPTADQRSVADAITASGAVDLIVGHHAHVVQPIEQVNGKWVVFGLGNQLSGMGDSTGCCGIRALDGLMVWIRIDVAADGTVAVQPPEAIPTYLGRRPYRVVPVAEALVDPAVAGGITTDELEASWERTVAVVGDFVAPPV